MERAVNVNLNMVNQPGSSDSYFDGGVLQYIGWSILDWAVTLCTLGICFPWSITMILKWKARHTVIEGRRLEFHGTSIGLFGLWIKWLLLGIITLGIYFFWVVISIEKWKAKHTRFAN